MSSANTVSERWNSWSPLTLSYTPYSHHFKSFLNPDSTLMTSDHSCYSLLFIFPVFPTLQEPPYDHWGKEQLFAWHPFGNVGLLNSKSDPLVQVGTLDGLGLPGGLLFLELMRESSRQTSSPQKVKYPVLGWNVLFSVS